MLTIAQPAYCTRSPRSRLVFDRLKNILLSEINTVIPLMKNILQPIKSLTDLARPARKYSEAAERGTVIPCLVQYAG